MKNPHRAWIAIVALLVIHALLAWSAEQGKSLTYDEPLHISAALVQRQLGDYRVDPEDPALFKWWMGLTLPHVDLPTDTDLWKHLTTQPGGPWQFAVLTVCGTAGAQAPAVIDRCHAMMLLVDVALGLLLAAWAWELAGPIAGVAAAAIFAFDPNVLAHGPLAKNDVASSLTWVLAAWLTWKIGRRITAPRAIALALTLAAAVTVKFAGVTLALLIPTLLLLRSFWPSPWSVGHRSLDSRKHRVLAAIFLTIGFGLLSYAVVWASYGFRYRPTADGTYPFDLPAVTGHVGLLLTVDHLHLLPQAYTYGLAYTIHSAIARRSFLLGQVRDTGWWYYFPIAMAVKTPLATIGMTLLAVVIGIRSLRAPRRGRRWSLLCLVGPPALYLALAMKGHLDIGVRHVLPVYAFAFVAIAAVMARHRILLAVLLVALAAESIVAYPDDLAFFNAAAGGSRGGLRILSDSNLDWGQDLPALAVWQKINPDIRLYLSYFGTADPGFYGIHYINAAAGYQFGDPPVMPTSPGVIAVSATHLQGLYVPSALLPFYQTLRNAKSREVLGGSIYLYDWPIKK